MREQVLDAYLLARLRERELGEEFPERVVPGETALLDQLRDGDGHERLCDRRQRKARVRLDRDPSLLVGVAEGAQVQNAVVPRDEHDAGEGIYLRERARDALDLARPCGVAHAGGGEWMLRQLDAGRGRNVDDAMRRPGLDAERERVPQAGQPGAKERGRLGRPCPQRVDLHAARGVGQHGVEPHDPILADAPP